MIGQAIISKLSSDPSVTAICGTRIYPNIIKIPDKMDANGKSLFPQASYEIKNPQYDVTYSGNSGLVYVDVVVTASGLTYIDCESLAQAIITSLDSQGGTWGGIGVDRCFFESCEDDKVLEPTSQAIAYYVKEITFNVAYYNDGTTVEDNGLSLPDTKADKVVGATAGHLASLTSTGDLADSGIAASSVATTSNLSSYLPLSGGTVTGNTTFPGGMTFTHATDRNNVTTYSLTLNNNAIQGVSSLTFHDGSTLTTAPTTPTWYQVLNVQNQARGTDVHLGYLLYNTINGQRQLVDWSNGGTLYAEGGTLSLGWTADAEQTAAVSSGTLDVAGGTISDSGSFGGTSFGTVYQSGTFYGSLYLNSSGNSITMNGGTLMMCNGNGSGGGSIYLDSGDLHFDSYAYARTDGVGNITYAGTSYTINAPLTVNAGAGTSQVTYSDNANNSGFVVHNTYNGLSSQATVAVENDAGVQGGMALFSSGFSNAGLKNNLTFYCNNAIQFLSNNSVASGGTSPIQFIAGGYGVTPQMTVLPTNKVLVGRTTDDGTGAAFQVSGNVSVSGSLKAASVIATGLSSAPTATPGTIYYNTTDGHFYGYSGVLGAWKQLDN